MNRAGEAGGGRDDSEGQSTCTFCAPKVAQVQEALRNEYVRLVYPLAPFIKPYVFLIPTRHVERFADLRPPESLAIFQAVKAVTFGFRDLYGATGMNLFTNDGKAAGQSANHVHFHLFGRYEGEPSNPFKVMNDPTERPARLQDEETSAYAQQIAAAVSPYWESQ